MKCSKVPNGFTLLEIMIALAILSFALLALYSGFGNSIRASGQAEQMEKALLLARGRIVEIKLSLDEDIERGAFPDEKDENGIFEKPFEDYRWAYSIKKVELPFINPSILQEQAGLAGDSSSEATPAKGEPGVENAANNLAQAVTKKISESIRELKLTVSWGEPGENEEKTTLTTHLVKLK